MKKGIGIRILVIVCCLALLVMVGCTKPEQPAEDPKYNVTISQEIEHGTLVCDKNVAKAGETVKVTATPDEGFSLVSITVNGEEITGNSFTMPAANAEVSATFALQADLIEAIPAGAIVINAVTAGGGKNEASIFLTFEDDGIAFKAYVKDSSITEKDGVAILFSREVPTINKLLPDGQTIKIAISAKGVVALSATDAEGVLQTATIEGVTTELKTWSANGTKLDGYMAKALIPYAALGTTAEDAKGTVTVCPVVYSAYGSLPAQSASLEDVFEDAQNTYAVLVDDNQIRENKFAATSAQLGSFGSVIMGEYWDVSCDYYAEDADNYPNRVARLTGHDNVDNNIVFNRVSANEMYARATLKVTGVSNADDQWPKFGMMLFDGAGKSGLFMYVDAVMSGPSGNTADNIIGRAIGYNRGTNNAYGSWETAKGDVFDLATKTITLEMVYQDGWVHMYADGELIKSLYYGAYNSNLHFGIKSFGIDLEVTNYLASDDAEADGWADKKQVAPAAKEVDILFAGDSYMEFWTGRDLDNCISYTEATYANIGVGATKVKYWADKASEFAQLYVPANIVFHIGVNDIDDVGADPNAVVEALKEMFDLYHAAFPDATIYWNSLIPNTMFADKYADYQAINADVLDHASDKDWLVYIDQTTSFDVNGQARLDVFDDGLHLNIDIGYPLWAKNIFDAMGYQRPDGTTMGDVEGFAHTGDWEFGTDDNGEYAYSFGNKDTQLWFKDIEGENVYVEAMLSITALRNSDGYPKFGLLVRNDRESRWGFIDAVGFNQANTTAGMAYRGVNGISQTSWDWGSPIWGGPTGCDFQNVKLAIAKIGNTVYFLVNDAVYCSAPFEGSVSVGYLCYNLETRISNVVTSTSVSEIEKKLGLACEDAEIDGLANDEIWTAEVLANTLEFGRKGDSGRYFTVAATKGTDGVYFFVTTYTYENTRSAAEWFNNANIEFRFGNSGTQRYIYVDGAGFNGVKTSGGIALAAIHNGEVNGDIYENTFEFFAPYASFPGFDASSEEIAISVFGWVWDSEGWNNIMNVGTWPSLTVSSHGLRFERKISVVGENAGVSVDVATSARNGDSVTATINLADGQTLEYAKVNGELCEVVEGKITFVMTDADAVIEVALAGIAVKSEIVNKTGEEYVTASVNCETATAVVGETVEFTVDHSAAAKATVKVNGEVVAENDGVYAYVVKATDTEIAIVVELEYNLSEAVDSVKGEGYGLPMELKVEGGRSFKVWAKTDATGVYLYAEAVSSGIVADAAVIWDNYNFEFRLNGAEHGAVGANGDKYRASVANYNHVQLENGMYLHTVEVYVNAGWIPNFDAENVTLNYAFKTPGELVWHENMINNQWNRADWWRTGHSTPHNNPEHIGIGEMGLPQCIHITANGITHDCERASIDGDLSEYAGKNALIGLGNDNAKFDFVGYVANDGVYLGITIYQPVLGEVRGEWWDNDNLEIKLLGDRAGFTIVEDFIAGCGSISDYALVRTEVEGGYKTIIELYYEYDFSTAKQATLQVGINGNGFKGWQSLMWDGNVPYVTENGIEWLTQGKDWFGAQLDVSSKFAEGEGLVIDGVANEDVYAGLTPVVYEDIHGTATLSVIGRKLSTGIALVTTINHTRPITDVIQGAGDAWWNFLNLEFRMGGNYSTQLFTSIFNNGNDRGYCASKAVSVDNGDGTYTTTFETFLPFTTEYGGMDYAGDVQICIGSVLETGFIWVTGLENSPLYANENGLITK